MAAARLLRTCLQRSLQHRFIFNSSSKCYPIQIQMPALSPTMEEGTIVKWLIAEGDDVEVGDALCEVETDKAVVTMEAMEDGKLAKILIAEGGDKVKVNVPIAILAEEGEDLASATSIQVTEEAAVSHATSPVETAQSAKPTPTKRSSMLSPAVRQTLQLYGLDATSVLASGPGGILLKGDILKYVSEKQITKQTIKLDAQTKSEVKPSPPAEAKGRNQNQLLKKKKSKSASKKASTPVSSAINYVDVEVNTLQKTSAQQSTDSKQEIPHSYHTVECSITKLVQMQKRLSEVGANFTVLNFIIKAAAISLFKVPEANSLWKTTEAEQQTDCDVSVTLATEFGSLTPLIKNASMKGLNQISREVEDLVSNAQQGNLEAANNQHDAALTIHDLGSSGVREFLDVLRPTHSSVLCVGATRLRMASPPASEDASSSQSVVPTIEQVLTLTMSSDSRAVDSVAASNFMNALKNSLENPETIGLL